MQAVRMHTGKVVHAGAKAGTREGYQLWKPLCGFGRKSLTYAGPVDEAVTCQKCLNRQAQLAARAEAKTAEQLAAEFLADCRDEGREWAKAGANLNFCRYGEGSPAHEAFMQGYEAHFTDAADRLASVRYGF